MELKEGTYKIPFGYKAVLKKGEVIILPRVRIYDLKDLGEYRCKDCKHYVKGPTKAMQRKEVYGYICDLRPKKYPRVNNADNEQIYYTALKYGLPCEKFELNEYVE